MARYQTTFTSEAPADAVFAYLSRFSTTAEWDPGVVAARDLTPDPVGLGSAFEVVASFLGARVVLRYEIVAFDPPNRVVLRAENASVRSTDTIRCERGAAADGGLTIVSYDAQLEPLGAARLAAPLLALAFTRIGDRAAAGLHEAVDRLAVTERDGEATR